MVFSTSSFSVARGGHKKVFLLQRSIEITTTSSLPTTKARVWLCGRRRRRRLQSRATFWNLEFVFCICISAYNLLSSVGHTKKIEREREREREREALLFYLMKSESFVWPRDDEKRRDESFDFFFGSQKIFEGIFE